MKKKQVVYLIIAMILAMILPENVLAKEKETVCQYQYKDITLNFNIKDNKIVKNENNKINNFYYENEFDNNFLYLVKNNNSNVCPTLTIEESQLFNTIFTKPKNQKDCNGTCTTIKAINNKKIAVDTTAISSVGIYNNSKYFIPYFRILNDNTKEWSVNGKEYKKINESITLKIDSKTLTTIKLDKKLINEVFKDNKLNSNITIYRNVKEKKDNHFEYLLSTQKETTYDLEDGQLTFAKAYVGAYGEKNNNTSQEDMDKWLEGYDQEQDCGSNGLLGNVHDEDSVAWLLQKILNYLKIIGPFIVIVMSGIDFTKVIITSDDDGMKKAQKKLIIRLILAGCLFFLPNIVMALLDIFGITSNATCGLK